MRTRMIGAAAWAIWALLSFASAGCDATDDAGSGANSALTGDDDNDDASPGDDDNDASPGDDDSGLLIELIDGGVPGEDGVGVVRTADGVIHIAAARAGFLYLHHYDPATAAAAKELLGRGSHPQLAIDGAERFHLVYWAADEEAVSYATNASGGWVSQRLFEKAWTTRMAVSADGVVHLVAIDPAAQRVLYLHNESSAFVSQEIARATGDAEVFGADIALDPTAGVHLAYIIGEIKWALNLRYSAGELTHASNRTGSWVKQAVYSGGICKTVSLDVDPEGFAHLGFERFRGYVRHGDEFAYQGRVSYATDRSGAWERQQVAECGGRDAPLRAMANHQGQRRLLYCGCGGDSACVYAAQSGGAWSGDVLPGASTSVVDATLDHAGALHAASGGASDHRTLGYATDSSGTLEWREVEHSVAIPGGLAAALDRDGRFTVAYLWASQDGEPAAQGWRLGVREADGWRVRSPLDVQGLGEQAMGLAYDDDGFAHIVYYDGGAKTLFHATNAPAGEWGAEPVATGEISCGALAWDGGASGQGHVAYTKFVDVDDNSGLFYAGGGAGAWQSEYVDQQANCPAIAAGAAGPHIAYSTEASGQLKHAAKPDGQWETERIEWCPSRSWPVPSIALDEAGGIHVAYPFAYHLKDSGHEEVHYAFRDGAEWRIEVVEPSHGSQVSLALDAGGQPHLAFFSESRGRFYYAFRPEPDHWGCVALGDAYDGATALAVDPNDVVHVSYASRLSYWGDSALLHARFPAGFEGR